MLSDPKNTRIILFIGIGIVLPLMTLFFFFGESRTYETLFSTDNDHSESASEDTYHTTPPPDEFEVTEEAPQEDVTFTDDYDPRSRTKVDDSYQTYIEVAASCDHNYQGDCVLVRSGPGTTYPIVDRLREGIVLLVDETVTVEEGKWHKIEFDEWLRYPERLGNEWYVSADTVELFYNIGEQNTWEHDHPATTTKRIVVNQDEQTLRAYEEEELIMEFTISTGIELTPTPSGTFTMFQMTPTRYMQGPIPEIPESDEYDLPGVPWNLYFTEEGAVVHGTYWHDSFGEPESHGCVNMLPEEARRLYDWAELGMLVVVE